MRLRSSYLLKPESEFKGTVVTVTTCSVCTHVRMPPQGLETWFESSWHLKNFFLTLRKVRSGGGLADCLPSFLLSVFFFGRGDVAASCSAIE